jgi:hypothetical protein
MTLTGCITLVLWNPVFTLSNWGWWYSTTPNVLFLSYSCCPVSDKDTWIRKCIMTDSDHPQPKFDNTQRADIPTPGGWRRLSLDDFVNTNRNKVGGGISNVVNGSRKEFQEVLWGFSFATLVTCMRAPSVCWWYKERSLNGRILWRQAQFNFRACCMKCYR